LRCIGQGRDIFLPSSSKGHLFVKVCGGRPKLGLLEKGSADPILEVLLDRCRASNRAWICPGTPSGTLPSQVSPNRAGLGPSDPPFAFDRRWAPDREWRGPGRTSGGLPSPVAPNRAWRGPGNINAFGGTDGCPTEHQCAQRSLRSLPKSHGAPKRASKCPTGARSAQSSINASSGPERCPTAHVNAPTGVDNFSAPRLVGGRMLVFGGR